EATCAYAFDCRPVNRILSKWHVPGRKKPIALLDVGNALHPLQPHRTFYIVGQHDAATGIFWPKTDMPSVVRSDRLQRGFEPIAPEVQQNALAGPIWKSAPVPCADGCGIEPETNTPRNEIFETVITS